MQLFLLFPLQVIAYLYKVSSWKALAALRPWGCCYHIICWQTRCKSGCLPLGIRSKVRFYEGKKRSFYLNLIFKMKQPIKAIMADYHTIRRCVTKILGMKPRFIFIHWCDFISVCILNEFPLHVQTSFLYIPFKMEINMKFMYSSELFQKTLQTH